ncbi:MAG: 3-hydroxyacyl-CoA dehydrogenase family protein [Clostridioides sp.]|nr:3-hydroxyacyl-CoA dehydrogenase family protein [Clostridioides sp.]
MKTIEDVKKVCVVGCGQMGKQIALNSAKSGFEVYLTDSVPAAVANAIDWAKDYLDGRVKKGKMTEDEAKEAFSHYHVVYTLEEAAKDADLVIEAIIEDRAIKDEFFETLSGLVAEDTVIATNSSFMVSSLFKDKVKNPARLANLHYFNPALVMKLTEVVQGEHTSEETIKLLMDFSSKTGKNPVWVRKEIDGFVVNRILRAITNEAMYLLTEGIATPQEIDIATENGLNHPMGPFKLMDLAGVDLSYLAAKRQLEETGVKKIGYEILEEKYNQHAWGRKTGKGWYDYSK